MIYGLYLSATGIATNAYRQDVIANNLANAETVGFKKDLALFQQRPTAAREGGLPQDTNSLLENLGGGTLCAPTFVDNSQGEIEPTGQPLDLAIEGNGFFAVSDHGATRLTRAGHFLVDREGHLALANGEGQLVLNPQGQPITLDPRRPIVFTKNGEITQDHEYVGRVGLVDVADRSALQKKGGTLMSVPEGAALLPAAGRLRDGALERGNVEPASELAALMDAQRQLEANANMIRYQDQTLSRLVNDVGKIG